MQHKTWRHIAPVLALILLLNSVLPTLALARQASEQRTVMVLALADAEGTVKKTEKDLARRITRDLKGRYHVIDPEVSAQILSTYLDMADAGEIQSLIRKMDGILDRYYSFRAGEGETLASLEKFVVEFKESSCVSQKCSDLLVTALMTKSWLHFEKKKLEPAKNDLSLLDFVSRTERLHPDYYPSAFRRFFREYFAAHSLRQHNLTLRSSPAAADVFVDGILAGVTPLNLELPAGDHRIAVKAAGRVVQSRHIKLREGKNAKLDFRLPWDARQKKLCMLMRNWSSAALVKKSGLVEKLAEASRSDFVVVVAEQNGQAAADVYNARHSQFYKTIPDDSSLLAQLNLYIHDDRPAYWSKNIEKKLVTNMAVASRRKKPLYRKAAFWGIAGAVAAAAVAGTVLALQQGGADQAQEGGVAISLGGL